MVLCRAMIDGAGCDVGGAVAFTVGEAVATLSVGGSADAVVIFASVGWGCVVAAVGAGCWVADSSAAVVCVQTMLTYKQLRLGFKI